MYIYIHIYKEEDTINFFTAWVGTNSFMSPQSSADLQNVNLQYNNIKIVYECSNIYCVKNIRIWIFFGPYFSTFRPNTESLQMQEKYESEKFQIEIFFTRGSGFRTHKLNFFSCLNVSLLIPDYIFSW